jgi:hypothetical protein
MPREAATDHRVDVTATIAEVYDDDVYAEGGPSLNPLAQRTSGYYMMMEGSGTYGWYGRRVQVGSTASSMLRYYHTQRDVDLISFSGGFGVSANFTERTRLFVNQSAAYSPSYLYGLFPTLDPPGPGDTPDAAPDYRVGEAPSYTYGTVATLSHRLSRRSTLSGTADYAYTDFVQERIGTRDARTYGIRVEFSRAVKRDVQMRLAYRYRNGDVGFGVTRPIVEHGVDGGMDYSRPLSATRRAVFGFTLGSSAVNVPESFDGVVVDTGARVLGYRAIGNVAFGYQFGRSWQAKASYRRSLEYVPELLQPVYTDGVSMLMEGLFTPRLDFTATAGYSNGESAFSQSTAVFDTYTASVRIRQALTRKFALYAEYLYYFYDFGGRLTLPPGLPPTLERNGVRAGLTLWLPAVRR